MTMKNVNIVIGRFQPITLGHMKIVEQMYNENNLSTVFCMVSNKKFDSKHPFSDDIISEELDIIMKNDKRVAGYIWITNADIVKCGEKLHEAGYEPLLWGCGTDRYDSYKKQADKYKEKAGLLPEFDVFEVKRTDDDISATKVRNAIKEDDLETFNKMMPKGTDKLFEQMKNALSEIKESFISLRNLLLEELGR